MKLSRDETKRQVTMDLRGLEFSKARELFAGIHFTAEDLRRDYGERRFISAGLIDSRLCIAV